MAVDRSYARLGLFLVVTLAVVLATALFFLHRMRRQPLLSAVTYTTENVSGLDVSSPVRFRGVTMGRVSDLRMDPRGSIIEIHFDLFLDRIRTLGGNVVRVQQLADTGLFSHLRAQVIGNPVTGQAYLLLDMPEDPPPPMALDFTPDPDRPYVPIMPSPMAKVQDRLPAVIDRAEIALGVFGEIIGRIPDSLDRSDRFFTNVERIFRESNLAALSVDSRRFFTATTDQIDRLSSDLERVLGTGGTLEQLVQETRSVIKAADLPATAQITRNASDHTILAIEDFRRSLPVIRESLEQLRELAKMLEEQPESVVYGPRPSGGKPR